MIGFFLQFVGFYCLHYYLNSFMRFLIHQIVEYCNHLLQLKEIQTISSKVKVYQLKLRPISLHQIHWIIAYHGELWPLKSFQFVNSN